MYTRGCKFTPEKAKAKFLRFSDFVEEIPEYFGRRSQTTDLVVDRGLFVPLQVRAMQNLRGAPRVYWFLHIGL